MKSLLLSSLLAAGMACSSAPSQSPAPGNTEPTQTERDLLVETVSGHIVDASGAALADSPVTVCGDQCFYGATDGEGNYAIGIDALIPVDTYAVIPHVEVPLARYYAPLVVVAAGDVSAPELQILELPADGPDLFIKGEPEAAQAQSATSGDVTLTIDSGVTVVLSIDDKLLGPAGKKFRALKVPNELVSRYAPANLQVRALYALGPFGAALKKYETTSASARLSIKNTLGLAAGQAVEVLAMDLELGDIRHRPGTFEPVAKAAVSSDGQTIEMPASEGLTVLSWVALR